MMRALKAVGWLIVMVVVVCAAALIAAWPLGALPSSQAADGTGGAGSGAVELGGGGAAGPRSSEKQPPAAVVVPPLTVSPVLPRPNGARPQETRHTPATPPASRRPAGEAITDSVAAAVRAAAADGVRQSVIAVDRRTGRVLAAAEPDLPLPSMSLVKLFIAVDLLDAVGGPQNLDPQTQDTLWRMITVSDDDAASRLWVAGGDAAIVQRTVRRFQLSGVRPPADPGMWGDTIVTASDIAAFMSSALADPLAGPWLANAMQSARETGADGFDQDFGMNTVTDAGSKQGWGCCLEGVRSLHSAGFTDGMIVVALSAAQPQAHDATMRADLTATVRAALGIR